MISFS